MGQSIGGLYQSKLNEPPSPRTAKEPSDSFLEVSRALRGQSLSLVRAYGSAEAGAALRRPSAHPELVDQHPHPGGAKLIVAHARREHVDDSRVDERQPGRLVDGLPVDALP